MKATILSLLATFLFCSLNAQSVRTFAAMGYDDAIIHGISSSVSYFIKVKPNDNIDQSKLVLNIEASPVLNPANSFVIVTIKDAPVTTQRITVSHTDSSFHVEIPLNRGYLQPDGRFIKVKVSVKMSISDEYCKDIENPGVWLNIKNNSYLAANTQSAFTYQRSLKEALQEFSSIYTPAVADVNDITAGALVYTLLKQTANANIYTGVYTDGDSSSLSGILAGSIDKLPAIVRNELPALEKGQGYIGLVHLPGAGFRTILAITGADVEGYKKAINTLASNRRMSSAFSEKVLISEAVPSASIVDNQSPLVTSLESLGATPGLLEGIGSLKTKYVFSLTEFNAIPDRLIFHLESFFSVLKPEDRGFLNIYLNQNLVYNANLANRSNFIEDIDLKPYLLTKSNTLEVEYRFHPGSNVCKDGFGNFFAFINTKSSTLTFSGEKENKFYSFFNFPAEFRKVPTKIVVSPSLYNSNIVSSVGELIYQLNAPFNANYSKLIVPPMVAADKTTMDDLSGFNVIALVNKNDSFVRNFHHLPVEFDRDFQLYKDNQGQTTYSINDFSNSGIAELFRERESTVLMITSLGADSMNKAAFESVVKNFSSQLTEIGSNVCVANSSGVSNYFFKIPDDSDLVSYRDNNSDLARFWNNYKFIVVAVLLLIVLAGFLMIRGKVKKSQDITEA